MSIQPDKFNITQEANLKQLQKMSGVDTNEGNSPLTAIAQWSLSLAEKLTSSDQSTIKKASDMLDKQATQKMREFEKNISKIDDVEKRIGETVVCLKQLSNIRKNLELHNKVIGTYNSRFIFKDVSPVACGFHTQILQNADKVEKALEKKLSQDVEIFSNKIVHNVLQQIQNGMRVDRDFLRDQYPQISAKFDALPDGLKAKALGELNNVLNRAYVANLQEKLLADPKSIIPESLKTVLKALELSDILQDANLQEAANKVSAELIQLSQDPAIGAKNLPEYADFIRDKIMAHASTALETKVADPKKRDALIQTLKRVHTTELRMGEKFKEISIGMKSEDIRAKILKFQDEVKEEFGEAQETISEKNMAKIEKNIRAALLNPIPSLVKVLNYISGNSFYNPEFSLDEILKDENIVNAMVGEIIQNEVDVHVFRANRWDVENEKYKNFSFDQSYSGSNYILGDGCCWAIALEWIKSMMHLGTAKIDSPSTLMPPKPIKATNITKADLKPTLKKFQTEILQTMNQSRITPEMRRLQALASLEVLLARKSMKTASKSGGLTEKQTFDAQVGLDAFFKKVEESEKFGSAMGFPTPLTESDGIIALSGYPKEGSGHAMVLQMDHKNGLYRFADPNYGMWTFPNKQVLVEKVTSFMESHYPTFEYFTGTVYSIKQ